MRILLDMDGVIADFVGGICAAHRRPNPYLDPANHGRFDMSEIWAMPAKEFWEPCGQEFWANLDPTAEALDIVETLTILAGADNVCVLSTPSLNPGCVPGKLRWLSRWFSQFERRFLFGPCKEFCAGPGRVLIDDWDRNVENFRGAGGRAVLVPRPWNSGAGRSLADFLRELVEAVQ